MNKVLFLLLCISSFSLLAQGEANNWYFGRNAGITFNTNPPSALTDGELNTPEGCSSISDVNGNLLMYTDGRTIWNRNHEIMSNANYFGGTGLNGDPSSTSSGLIVPHPTEPNLYFVFTVDEPHQENAYAYPNQGPANRFGNSIPVYTDTERGVPEEDDGFNNGLNYSIVDMNLNNGLGDVISGERNNELITYDPDPDGEEIKYKASEKITAVRGRDCNSVWVITHFRNKFYAFYLDENGIEKTPVISTVAPLIEITNYRRAALGYLKASPKADKLLIAHNTTNYNPQDGNQDAGDGNVYAYDFDNFTGEVENPVQLISNVRAYGVEFSQDGTKAYATVNDSSSKIYQWDLSSDNVAGSMELVANIQQSAALQLGPDGRIYHSLLSLSRLGVIRNPDAVGTASGYTENLSQGAISLNNNTAVFGLPPFIQSLFSKRIPIIDTSDEEVLEQMSLCDTSTYRLTYEEIPGATYTWSKEGEVIVGETNYFLDVNVDETAKFPLQENYRLEVDLNNGECPLIGIAQLNFNKSPEYSDVELLACKEAGNSAVFDFTEIREKLSQQVNLSTNTISIELYKNRNDAELGNNKIPVTPNFVNSENLSSIIVKVSTFGVCESNIEIELVTQDLPDIQSDEQIMFYCLDEFPETLTLSALEEAEDASNLEFLWSTGEISPEIEINSSGTYSVDVNIQGAGCSLNKTFTIKESNIASFDHEVERFGNISSVEILINPSSLGDYEFAIDEPENFQDSNRFENLYPGIYSVYVKDKFGCGMSQKSIGVLGIMEFFTPNGDGINDVWKISGLLDNNEEDILLYVYDRYGKLLKSFTNRETGWDGTYNGKNMPTDDYWYKIRLTDGTIETGNFMLKR